jgi:hypothetical protein
MTRSLAKTSFCLIGAGALGLLLTTGSNAAFAQHGGHYSAIGSKSLSGSSDHKARPTTAPGGFTATSSPDVRDHRSGAGWPKGAKIRDHRTITKLQQSLQHCILCL